MNRILAILFCSIFAMASAVAQPEVKPDEEVFTIVQQMPRFPGCEDIEGDDAEKKKCAEKKMLEFIYSNISYPDSAVAQGIEGMVVLNFIVAKDGSITNPKVVRDIGGGCGQAALDVITQMPTWVPGRQKGEIVNVTFNIPVRFKLEDPFQKLYEVPEYKELSIVFCEDFAGEFFTASDLNSWADAGYNMNNLCGFESKVTKLEITYVDVNETERSLESEGELTASMRDYFRKAVPGSVIRLMITIERAGLRGKIIKVLLVE